MSDRKSGNAIRTVRDSNDIFGFKPRGQRGYQPQSSTPLDPMKLTPPTGGSAVQPPSNGTPQANQSPPKR